MGAGGGIGLAVGRKFAAEGLHVALTARNKDHLVELVEEIQSANEKVKVLSFSCQCSDANNVKETFNSIREQIGAPSVLIFNASAFTMGPFLELSEEQFTENWQVSCLGAFLNAKEVLPDMVKETRGTMIFTGATAGVKASSGFAAFASAKHGLRALTQVRSPCHTSPPYSPCCTVLSKGVWIQRNPRLSRHHRWDRLRAPKPQRPSQRLCWSTDRAIRHR